MERKTLDIVLTNRDNIEGDVVCVIDNSTLEELLRISKEREKLAKQSEKLNQKKAKAIRHAQKIISQFAKSRQLEYDNETRAIGIYQGETIYIGSFERLKEDPTAEPLETDEIKGKLTKSEKRLYKETLDSYVFLNKQITEYLNDLTSNEIQLISFQTNALKDKVYDVKKNHLIVSTNDGKVYLGIKQDVVDENIEDERKQEEQLVEEVGVEDGRN